MVFVVGLFDRRGRTANISLECLEVIGLLASDGVTVRPKHARGCHGREESESSDGVALHICDDDILGARGLIEETVDELKSKVLKIGNIQQGSRDRQEKEWPVSREDSQTKQRRCS